jgi:hypothetical protein
MKFNIEPSHFEELIKNQYSLDYVYLLLLINEGFNVLEMCKGSERIKALHTSLIRRGLIYEHEEKLTLQGKHLLTFVSLEGEVKLKKEKPSEDVFEQWWKAFPGTNNFKVSGVEFTGDRTLRQNKNECRVKFNKILLEGEWSAEQLIKALEIDVRKKLESSLKTRQNKLTYMQNSLTYLNQRSYEPYIQLISSHKEQEEPSYNGGIDI